MRVPLSWLVPRPRWLTALAAPPFRWLTRAESRSLRAALAQGFGEGSGAPGYSLSPAARAACRARLGKAIPIAKGPARKNRTGDVTQEALWLLDPARPSELWLALEPMIPPLLWLPAGTTAASAREALAPYFPS